MEVASHQACFKAEVHIHADPAQTHKERDVTGVPMSQAQIRRLPAPGKLSSSAGSTDLPLLPALDETRMVGSSSGSGLGSTPGSKGGNAW